MPSHSYSSRVETFYTYDSTNNLSPIDDVHSRSSQGYVTSFRSRTTSGNYPDWRRRIAHGDNATTALYGSELVFEGGGSMSCIYDVDQTFSNGWTNHRRTETGGNVIVISSPGIPAPAGSASYNQALMRFVSAARGAQSSLKGFVALAELKKTMSLLRGGAFDLWNGVVDYCGYVTKRAPRIARKRRKKWLSEVWLEYAYGWAPTIADIDGACKALAENTSFVASWQPVRGFGESEAFFNGSLGGRFVGGNQFNWSTQDLVRYHTIFRGVVKRKCENPVYLATESFGFTPWDFVPAIWECIPLSFLADYFTNIGDILDAWSFHNLDLHWINCTTRTETTRRACSPTVSYRVPSAGPNPVEKIVHQYYVPVLPMWRRKDVIRSTFTGTLVPRLEFTIPGFGSTKWLNMATLANVHTSAVRSLRI